LPRWASPLSAIRHPPLLLQPALPSSTRILIRLAGLLSEASALAVDTEGDGAGPWPRSSLPGPDRDAVTTSAASDCAASAARPPACQQLMKPGNREGVPLLRFDVAALGKGWGFAVETLFWQPGGQPPGRAPKLPHGLKRWFRSWWGVSSTPQARAVTGRSRSSARPSLAYAPTTCAFLLPALWAPQGDPGAGGTLELARRCFRLHPVFSELDRRRFGSVFEHWRQIASQSQAAISVFVEVIASSIRRSGRDRAGAPAPWRAA